jgi:hypothetical protein
LSYNYSNSRRVYLLVDSRHGMKTTDIEMMKLLDECGLPYQARTALLALFVLLRIASIALYCTVSCVAMVYCLALYCSALCAAIQYILGIVLYYTVTILYYTILPCTVVYRSVQLYSPPFPASVQCVLYRTVCAIQHCTTLHHTTLH